MCYLFEDVVFIQYTGILGVFYFVHLLLSIGSSSGRMSVVGGLIGYGPLTNL